jgi:diketogulonate reductase-like aldo/keto reductase
MMGREQKCSHGLYLALLLTLVLTNSQQVPNDVDCQGHKALLQVAAKRDARIAISPDTVALKIGSEAIGINMPLIGLGTAKGIQKDPLLKSSIASFLEHGGQLIDTAILYGQPPVGEVLQTAMKEKGMTRNQFWVTSKIMPHAANTAEETEALVDQSLKDLGLEYIDLFLIHFPGPRMKHQWKGLIHARDSGKLRAIGVSNFSPEQISKIEEDSGERPSVNQFLYHPWVEEKIHENVKWCLDHGIAVTAYGSLGDQYHKGLENPKILAVASKHGKTPAQVLLRWALYQGVAVIPGATSEHHIVENLEAGNFELDADESKPSFFRD